MARAPNPLGNGSVFGGTTVPCPLIKVTIQKVAWKNNYSQVSKSGTRITGNFEWTPTQPNNVTPDPDNFIYAGCSEKPAVYFTRSATAHTEPELEVTIKVDNLLSCHNAIPDDVIGLPTQLEINFGGLTHRSDFFNLPSNGGNKVVSIKFAKTNNISWLKGEPTFTLYYGLGRDSALAFVGQEIIEGDNSVPINLEMFTLYDTPASFYTNGVWVEALRFLFEKTGISTDSNVIESSKKITRYCHSDHNATYDTFSGANSYVQNHLGAKFYLTAYLKLTNGDIVNCYDQAGAVQALCGALGINTQWIYMGPYGFISDTNLINNSGLGACNNPFYDAGFPYSGDRKVDMIRDASGDLTTFSNRGNIFLKCTDSNNTRRDSARSLFGNHAFILLTQNNCILDACAGPALATESLSAYAASAIDKECNEALIGLDGPALVLRQGVIDRSGGLTEIE